MPVQELRIEGLNAKYAQTSQRDKVYLLLHGLGDGIDKPYTQELLTRLTERGEAALAFNFPYMDQPGEKHASGLELSDECRALQAAIDFLHREGYARISVIAKSLGGIVMSHWLAQHPNAEGI